MKVRGRAVHKNHNPTRYILQSYLPFTIYFSQCMSGPYRWKYKSDRNETWFI